MGNAFGLCLDVNIDMVDENKTRKRDKEVIEHMLVYQVPS